MAVVSISRQFGAGGKTMGEIVANRLGYRFLHETMLDTLAEEAMKNQSGEIVHTDYSSRVVQLINSLAPTNFMDRWSGGEGGGDEKKHIDNLTRVIKELAAQNNVVLLGRGSQFILRHHVNSLRVLLVAEPDHRVGFLTKNYQMDERTAKSTIKNADRTRTKFLRNFYPGEPDESSLYHVVLNTSLVPLEAAWKQVVNMVKRMEENA